jgi:NAD(P)-dependent dehydrogenase (short-subunit alcohol dehydrogenase family)
MSKVWFVTGAGSGIGAATARAALKAGDRVVATGRNLDKVHNALSDVAGDRLAFVELDVTKEAQAKAAVEAARRSDASTCSSTMPATACSEISRS